MAERTMYTKNTASSKKFEDFETRVQNIDIIESQVLPLNNKDACTWEFKSRK